MRSRQITVSEGEPCGPIDWTHETARDMPDIWREAEANPKAFLVDYGHGGREIVSICMYDGWPYWKPRPAIAYIGPLNSVEWSFFDSYGIRKNSIIRKPESSP